MYDKKKYFDSEILPLIQEIQQKCNENKIPYFSAYGYKMGKDGKFKRGDGIFCSALLPEILGIANNDSFFADFINIINGAHAIYSKEEEFEADM